MTKQLQEWFPDIVALRDQGLSDRQIATRLGCWPDTVRRIAGSNGKFAPPRDPAFVAAARKLWMQQEPRLSVREIGIQLGVSENVVVGIAHRNDFLARPSPIGITKLTAGKVRWARAQLKAGAARITIARSLGVDPRTVDRNLRAARPSR